MTSKTNVMKKLAMQMILMFVFMMVSMVIRSCRLAAGAGGSG